MLKAIRMAEAMFPSEVKEKQVINQDYMYEYTPEQVV
jgi:anthranilate synthase component 1